MNDDVIRILVSTDNHLGYAERDPIRCHDALSTFEEVLSSAKKNSADFILLAGDMFHENKPSRGTLWSTMELLRKYCFGDDPIYTEIISDHKDLFKSNFGKVNYEDPFQRVCMPVFAIHGNHDDPSREGGMGEALAALDLLAVSNLINYVGKVERVEDIVIQPILLRKGPTKIAIYALGAVRDERLNRMWTQKKVQFVRLTEQQGRDDFLNLFILHQNRDYGRGQKNCVHESMIPEWMDIVIWGNEHECQPQLMESLVGTFRILQPGSSIASSFSMSESSLCPKHMAIIEVKLKKYRMTPIRYQNIRQFLFDDISLKNQRSLDPQHPKVEDQIKIILTEKINLMIQEARKAVKEPSVELMNTKYTLKDPMKVLIRLRVDHEGFPAINHQRLGAQFVGEVANPIDIILLTRRRKTENTSSSQKDKAGREGRDGRPIDDMDDLLLVGDGDDKIHKIKIEDMVNDSLLNSKNRLSILAESEMGQALEDYVIKKQTNAILDLVNETLERTQNSLRVDKSVADKAAIQTATEKVKQHADQKFRKSMEKHTSSKPMDLDMDMDFPVGSKPAAKSVAVPSTQRKQRVEEDSEDGVDRDDDSMSMASLPKNVKSKAPSKSTKATVSKGKSIEDDDETIEKETKKRPSRTTAKKVIKSYQESDENDEEDDAIVNDSDEMEEISDVVDDASDDDEVGKKKNTKKGNVTTKKAPVRKNTKQIERFDEDDDEEELVPVPPKKATTARKIAAAKPRGGKATKQSILTNSLSDVSENDVGIQSARNKTVSRSKNNKVIELEDFENDDEDKFTFTSKSSALQVEPKSSVAMTSTPLNISQSENSTGRKRQLPLSFTQTSSSALAKKAPAKNKTLTSGWG